MLELILIGVACAAGGVLIGRWAAQVLRRRDRAQVKTRGVLVAQFVDLALLVAPDLVHQHFGTYPALCRTFSKWPHCALDKQPRWKRAWIRIRHRRRYIVEDDGPWTYRFAYYVDGQGREWVDAVNVHQRPGFTEVRFARKRGEQ